MAKSSFSSGIFSQFARSPSPSSGEAEACTPLSPVVGSVLRPSSFQSDMIIPRIDSAGAEAGSVGPKTLPRKSAHGSLRGRHAANVSKQPSRRPPLCLLAASTPPVSRLYTAGSAPAAEGVGEAVASCGGYARLAHWRRS